MKAGLRRLFLALSPPQDVREALSVWQDRFLPEQVAMVHSSDLHLTLHFIGAVGRAQADALIQIGETSVLRPFELRLQGLGCFTEARVTWAGVAGELDALHALHQELARRLAAQGLVTERRPYRPHVTLARACCLTERNTPEAIPWKVSEWGLFESCPGSRPAYRSLALWSEDKEKLENQ